MENGFRILLTSPPDREKLVAEIFFGDEQCMELNEENGPVAIEIYPRRDGRPWEFKLDEILREVEKARTRLTSR